MINEIINVLQDYEQRVSDRKITTFTVCFRAHSIEVIPAGSEKGHEIHLLQKLQDTLLIFFYDNNSVTYGSTDYSTFRSLMNAHASLERMALQAGKNHNEQ
ncbi:hypothetical protein [Pontibacter liquoris]|uniref:hypothetical protein n=1 Tax=Pontibacter liquoris TaxID=2905677 RepID=UPI001FA6D054|nr:hypothetical protein [Pontibacter liquoris]